MNLALAQKRTRHVVFLRVPDGDTSVDGGAATADAALVASGAAVAAAAAAIGHTGPFGAGTIARRRR